MQTMQNAWGQVQRWMSRLHFHTMQVLCIQGFLACRKHADRIILLVEMMQGSGCPAFKAGPRCVHNLRKRYHLNLTETQVCSRIHIIASSFDGTQFLRLSLALHPMTLRFRSHDTPKLASDNSLRLWHST